MNKIFLLTRSVLNQCLNLCVFVCIVASLLDGCVSGTLSNMWRDPSFQSSPMKNILIIAVRKNPVRRRIWEDGFVAELSKHGITATQSYRLFPEALPDTDQCVAAVRTNGYDGIIVTRRLGVDTMSNFISGYMKDVPVTRYNKWTHTYYTFYRQEEVPGYTEVEKTARHEVNVWTTKEEGRLVWSAIGGIVETTSGQSVNDEIAGLIVPELANQGIIPEEK